MRRVVGQGTPAASRPWDQFATKSQCNEGDQLRWFAAIAFLVCHSALAATIEDTTVLFGLPSTKVSESSEETVRDNLRPERRQESIVIIEKRDGKYYWVSRGNRELFHRTSGEFHVFLDMLGDGYVKVYAIDHGDGFEYLEHLPQRLETITYHGISSTFHP